MFIKQTLTTLTLAAAVLSVSACRSTLYNAARDGDLQTVKEELAEGTHPEGKASAANLIWQVPTSLLAAPIDVVRVLGPITLIEPLFDPGWEFTGEVDRHGNRKIKFNFDTLLTKKVYQFSSKTAISAATNPEIITELLLAGAQGSDYQKSQATSEAARKGDAATLQKLLQKGIKASWYCDGDYNPLMLAIGGGHEECARILLENGASFYSTVTIQGKEVSCIDYATAKGQVELYTKLGGATTLAPVSVAKKTLSFKVTQTDTESLENYEDSFKWGNSNDYVKETRLKDLNKEERQIAKEAGATDLWHELSLYYTKTGYKTAKVEEYDGFERSICNEYTSIDMNLTFDTPTSGTFTAEYSSRNRNGSGQISGTFTLK